MSLLASDGDPPFAAFAPKLMPLGRWRLAIVLLTGEAAAPRLVYVIPRVVADRHARQDKPTSKTASLRYCRIDEVERLFGAFRDNFALQEAPVIITEPVP